MKTVLGLAMGAGAGIALGFPAMLGLVVLAAIWLAAYAWMCTDWTDGLKRKAKLVLLKRVRVYGIPEGHGRGMVVKEKNGHIRIYHLHAEEYQEPGTPCTLDAFTGKVRPVYGVEFDSVESLRAWAKIYANAADRIEWLKRRRCKHG